MSAYLVVETDWKDADLETRTAFGRAAQPVIQKYGGRFLTPVGLKPETLEGDWNPLSLTIVEFPNGSTIHKMWDSPEYQEAVAVRKATTADFKIVMVSGHQ